MLVLTPRTDEHIVLYDGKQELGRMRLYYYDGKWKIGFEFDKRFGIAREKIQKKQKKTEANDE